MGEPLLLRRFSATFIPDSELCHGMLDLGIWTCIHIVFYVVVYLYCLNNINTHLHTKTYLYADKSKTILYFWVTCALLGEGSVRCEGSAHVLERWYLCVYMCSIGWNISLACKIHKHTYASISRSIDTDACLFEDMCAHMWQHVTCVAQDTSLEVPDAWPRTAGCQVHTAGYSKYQGCLRIHKRGLDDSVVRWGSERLVPVNFRLSSVQNPCWLIIIGDCITQYIENSREF